MHHATDRAGAAAPSDKEAFALAKTLAVVGVSRSKAGFGRSLFSHLKRKGYRVYPVNAQADAVDGERCFHRLDDLPEIVEGVVTVVPPSATEKVVEDCGRLGIRRVWMQQGSESPSAIARCRDLGIATVAGECLIMHTGGGFPHSVHRLIWKALGKYSRRYCEPQRTQRAQSQKRRRVPDLQDPKPFFPSGSVPSVSSAVFRPTAYSPSNSLRSPRQATSAWCKASWPRARTRLCSPRVA